MMTTDSTSQATPQFDEDDVDYVDEDAGCGDDEDIGGCDDQDGTTFQAASRCDVVRWKRSRGPIWNSVAHYHLCQNWYFLCKKECERKMQDFCGG